MKNYIAIKNDDIDSKGDLRVFKANDLTDAYKYIYKNLGSSSKWNVIQFPDDHFILKTKSCLGQSYDAFDNPVLSNANSDAHINK